MIAMLLTRAQALRVLVGWGYVAGNLPTVGETNHTVTLHIPAEYRDNPAMTRAQLSIAGRNGAGHQLYALSVLP